jgi:hypothetical protein
MAVIGYTGSRQGRRHDHKFSVGYPSFEKEGVVSQAGNIRPGLSGMNCNLEKSDLVAGDSIKESRRAIRMGVCRCVNAAPLRLAHGTRSAGATATTWSAAPGDGTVRGSRAMRMRWNHPPIRRLSGRQRISCLKQVSAPASPAPVGVFCSGGPTLSSRHDDGYETIVASIGLSLALQLRYSI